MSTVLITGAAGYVGSQLAQRLSAEMTVIGVDIRQPAESACAIFDTDIRDPALAELMLEHGVSSVVHLASVVENSGDEARDYDIDVNGTRNVFECCVKAGVKQMIVTSSGAAYGYHADNPDWIDESCPLRGNDEFAYSRHKRLVEEYLAQQRIEHPEVGQLILRPGTVLGANTRNQITNLFEKKRVLAIRGSDSPFIFIWDQDVIAIIEQGIREQTTGIFNLAGDGALRIDEVAQLLDKPIVRIPAWVLRAVLTVGHKLGIGRYSPQQVNFLRYRPVLSNQKLKAEFPYQPQRSSRETLEYFIEHARARGQL